MGYKDIDIIFKLEHVDGNHPASLRYDESVTCKTIANCDKVSHSRKKNNRSRKFSKNRDDDLRWSVVRVNIFFSFNNFTEKNVRRQNNPQFI